MRKIFNSKSPPKGRACADSRRDFWTKNLKTAVQAILLLLSIPSKISHSTAHDKPLIAAGSQGFRKCLYGDSGQGGAEGMEARQVQSLPEVLP